MENIVYVRKYSGKIRKNQLKVEFVGFPSLGVFWFMIKSGATGPHTALFIWALFIRDDTTGGFGENVSA